MLEILKTKQNFRVFGVLMNPVFMFLQYLISLLELKLILMRAEFQLRIIDRHFLTCLNCTSTLLNDCTLSPYHLHCLGFYLGL